MPINAYTGLMGSGKSFECVVSVIIPAIRLGRRVVTNVDGIDSDAIRAYCQEKFNSAPEKLGSVIHCKNEDVAKSDFLPFGTDAQTFVQSGDMVCIDEAWRFWGTDCKILKEHAIFFREHRHYVNPITNVSCDLVLMVQDISDLHRTLKVVVELSFRTTKIKSLGLSKIYRVEMWEGYKQNAKRRSAVENKKYDPAIFPLYSSYVGGKGNELQVDERQNILKSPKLWAILILMAIVLPISIYYIIQFFTPPKKVISSHTKNNSIGVKNPSPSQNHSEPITLISEHWRIVGTLYSSNKNYVVLQSSKGQVRIESPSLFQGTGPGMVGTIDNELITTWSGFNASYGVLPEQPK